MADVSDVAVITLGHNSGKGRDRPSGEGDFGLSAAEWELLTLVATAFHAKNKNVVAVLNMSGIHSWHLQVDQSPVSK